MTVPDATGVLRHRDRIEGDLVIEVAFTDVSLSLGDAAPEAVRSSSLGAFAEVSGTSPAVMDQVHGADVVHLDLPVPWAERPTCDALITSRPGLSLLARAADCVPVLLADPAAGWVAPLRKRYRLWTPDCCTFMKSARLSPSTRRTARAEIPGPGLS